MSISGGSPISAQVQLDLGQLKAQVDQAVALTDKLGTSLKAIPSPKLDAQPLTHSAAEVQGVVDSLQGALGKLGQSHGVGLDVSSLQTAGGVADPILKGLSGGFLSLGAATAIGTTSIVAFAATATAAVVQLGEQYATAFRQIAARTGETGPALEATQEALAKLSATSPRPIEQLAAAFIPLKQILQQTDDQTATTTTQILKFARATGVDATQAAGDLARLFTAFGVSVEQQPTFLDHLTVAIQKTGVSEAQLTEGLRAAGPTLRAFGLSADEATAFVANLSTAGVDVSEVLRGLRTALGNLSGANAKAELEDLFTYLGNDAVDENTRLQRSIELFGRKSGPELFDLAKSGRLSTDELVAAMQNSEGATDHAAAAMKTNFDRIGALIEIGKKQWAPYGLAAVEGMNTAAGAVLDGLSHIGKDIDDFLASDRVRQFAATLLQLKGGVGSAPSTQANTPPPGAPPTTPAAASALPGRDALQGLLATGLPQIGQAASGAGSFLGTGISQDVAILGTLTDRLHTTSSALADEQQSVGATSRAFALLSIAHKETAEAAQQTAVAVQQTTEQLADEATKGLRTASGLVDYAKALQDVHDTNGGVLQILLEREKAQAQLDAGIQALASTEVRATAIAAEHAAAQQRGAEQAKTLAALNDYVRASLEQQATATTAAAGAFDLLHTKLDGDTAAWAKAADAGVNFYAGRLAQLTDTLLPSASAAEAVHIKQLQALGDTEGLVAVLVEKTGLSHQQVTAILESSDAQYGKSKQALDAYGQSLENLASDQVQQRISSSLGALETGTNAATAALAVQQVKAGDAQQAIETLARAYGVSKQQADAWATALAQGGQAAADAKLQIDAMAKGIAGFLTDEDRSRIGSALGTLSSGVDDVTAALAKQQQASGHATAALETLAAKYGVSKEQADQWAAALEQGGLAADQARQQMAALAKGIDSFFADEQKARITSALGALSSGVDAGTAALAKQQEASGNATGALETLTAQYGVSKQQADAWAGALQQGGAAAQIAQAQMALLTATTGAAGAQLFGLKEQLSALTTFAHDPTTGTIRLKVEIDTDQAQRQLAQLVQTYQDTFNRNINTPGTKGFLGQELEAQKAYQGQLNETAKGFSDLTAQGLDAAHKLDDAWAASAKQLATDYGAAVAQTNAAFKSLPTLVNPQIGTVPSFSGTRTDLLSSVAAGIQGDQTAARSVADDPKAFLALARATQDLTNQKQELYDGFAQTIGDVTDSHTKALQSISDSTNQAIKSAGDAQGAALRSLSSAMQAFNDQQSQANANASITLQNAQLQAAGLDASTVGGQTNAQRLQQIQQQGLAALQQTGQAAQLNQARVGANVASNQAQDQLTKAVNDGAAQTREANKAYAKQVGDAAGSLAKALYALQQTYERASEDQAQARKDAIAAQSKAIAAAQSAEESRAKQLREQEAQQLQQQQQQREQLLRQDQDVRKKFLDEDADRAKQRQDTDKQFRDEFLKQSRAIGNLEALLDAIRAKVPTAAENAKAIAERLQLGPQQITQNIQNVNETGVDYADYLGISLLRRVRSGV